MQVKCVCKQTYPYPHNLHRMHDIPGVAKLTPAIARIALAGAFPGQDKGEVWDLENRVGYKVYGKSARKIKW